MRNLKKIRNPKSMNMLTIPQMKKTFGIQSEIFRSIGTMTIRILVMIWTGNKFGNRKGGMNWITF